MKNDDSAGSSMMSTPKVILPADGATSQIKIMLEANSAKSFSCKAIADAVFEQPAVKSTRQGDYAKSVVALSPDKIKTTEGACGSGADDSVTAEPLPKMKLKLDED